MKVLLGKFVAGLIISPRLRTMGRVKAALRRRLSGGTAQLHYFHQVDDPYSHLMLQVLPALAANPQLSLVIHVAPPPDAAAAPDRERLQAWSRRDGMALAGALYLDYADPGQQPHPTLVARAQQAAVAELASMRSPAEQLRALAHISKALWRGDADLLAILPGASAEHTGQALAQAAAWRARRGHYLGGTLYFEGEWYWGIDRLHHLERRLAAQDLARRPGGLSGARMPALALASVRPSAGGRQPVLHFFCSPRSPYTYLAVERVARLAEHYGAQLELRFVLPMIMRGLPVPSAKRLYIARDTKREAEALGLPFGPIADPLGKPTERCLAVLHQALRLGDGRGIAFFTAFMRGVWAEGIDAGSEAGLCRIALRAGLDAPFVHAALADESWRAVAQANRDEMLACGLWGVPTMRVDDGPARWGQDRLWQVEHDLISATRASS